MYKYIIGTLLILWCKFVNLKFGNSTPRIEPKVPWYRQLVWFYSPQPKFYQTCI